MQDPRVGSGLQWIAFSLAGFYAEVLATSTFVASAELCSSKHWSLGILENGSEKSEMDLSHARV